MCALLLFLLVACLYLNYNQRYPLNELHTKIRLNDYMEINMNSKKYIYFHN